MASAARPTRSPSKTTAKTAPGPVRPAQTEVLRAAAGGTVSQLEFMQLLQKGSVIEVVIAEVEQAVYQLQLVVALHYGRKTLMTSTRQARGFRSLDTLRKHLKTLGIGNTLVRLELLP
ncbi:hypothetical protein [uncultured Variovorax sp.]|jgi:hypothetical protein|uniref:hypothetical protein n=1 Tax=uncultured Variovorax sp. TaxID=114708 RepID=UPI00261F98BF|nr:hypothetical protein [uncultured Variovorax sp.]